MAAPNTPYLISSKQQEAVVKYVQNAVESLSTTWNLREQFLLRDIIYQREIDRSVSQQRALAANLAGDPTKLQNMTMPIVMPQIESALAYQAGVFFMDYPIFGIASNPQNMDVALQLETIIANNSIEYGWLRHLIMFLRDGLKYNLGFLETEWKRNKIYSLITDPGKKNAKVVGGTPGDKEIYYEGNCLKRIDPYNAIWDKRVMNPAQHHIDGEFIGYTELNSRIQLKQLMLDLDAQFAMNGTAAFQSGVATVTINTADSWYFIPNVNPLSFLGTQQMPTTNWLSWSMIDGSKGDKGIQYNNVYEVTKLYARIIPSDFGLMVPNRNQPQIWKFIIINRKVCLYAERMTNAHNFLPILICQPNEDGLGYQTKSFLDNATPFQFMGSNLWTAALESKRREVFDRILYDPSRIRSEDINKATSIARIPVKQSAYGRPISEAVYAFPYRGENISETLGMAQTIADQADLAVGQNRVDRGQFQKGNKSKYEFQTTMGNSNSRQQLTSLGIEHQTMAPLKCMLKYNMLQYQSETTYYNQDKKQPVDIKPEDIRKTALEFKVSDGLLSTDKMLNSDLLQVFMQTLQTSPLLQSQFDIIGAFVYWCKLQGAQWLDDFKRNPADAAKVMQQITEQTRAEKTPVPQQQPAPAAAP